MRDTRDEPGSLNAIWPSGPIPPINSSIPPASVIFRSNSAHSASLSGAFPSRIWTFSGSMSMCCKKKFQMLFEQNIASNVTRNAGAQTYKT